MADCAALIRHMICKKKPRIRSGALHSQELSGERLFRLADRDLQRADPVDAAFDLVAALDEGSLAGAGRKLGRSPAAVSRAIAFLEAHVGAAAAARPIGEPD